MSGFTKLVPEIIQSSIWNEPSDIRIVWITLLAIKDQDGYVRGDSRTIARLANVPLDVAVKALETFQAPDPLSHTADNEGRRIAQISGGWIVLNHELYRVKDQKAEHAAYVRQWRQKRNAKDVKECDSQMNHSSVSVSVSSSSSKGGCKGEGHGDEPRNRQWTLAECKAAAGPIGVPDVMVQAFFDHYAAVGWIDAMKRPIVRLPQALAKWKANQASRDQRSPSGGYKI